DENALGHSTAERFTEDPGSIMATDHEYWRGQSEIYALGALDGEELNEFQAHLAAGCPLCDATVHETGESLALLPVSLEPLTPPPALRGRILAQIDHEK